MPSGGGPILDRAVARARAADTLSITVRTGDAPERTVRIALARQIRQPTETWYALIAIGILLPISCQLLGFSVAAFRPLDPQAWLLLLCALGFGHRFSLDSEFRDGTVLSAFSLGYLLAVVDTYFGWLLWLTLRFPKRLPLNRRAPWLKWAAIAPVLALALQDVIYQEVRLIDLNLANWWLPALQVSRTVGAPLRNVCFALSVLVIAARFFVETDPDHRRRLRLFFAGTLTALLPSEILVQLARYTGRGLDTFPPHVEVSLQALHRRRVPILESAMRSGPRSRRRVTRRAEDLGHQRFHLRLHHPWQLGQDVAHLVHLTPLATGVRPDPLDRVSRPRQS